ncbi:XPC-binding domain-containing protein [Ditylenchus destructor]|nr:XPC-binding domain-containing protein [Ditylenchus destructor]
MEPINSLFMECILGAKGRIFRTDDSLAAILGYNSTSLLFGAEIHRLVPGLSIGVEWSGVKQMVYGTTVKHNGISFSEEMIMTGKWRQRRHIKKRIGSGKKKKKAAEPTSSSASTKTATSESKSDAAAPAAKPAEEKKAADTTQPAQAAALTPSEVPQEHQQTVEAIQAMGYPRDEVVRALRASFFNADRAVEYLCSGIPDIDINDQSGAAPVAGEQGGDSDADEAEAQGLDFLQSSAQFQQLRDLVRTDPAILPQTVQQIAESNPQLMNAIRDNQEEFLQLLNTDAAGASEADAGAATGGAAAAGGTGAPQQPGVVTIAVTENNVVVLCCVCEKSINRDSPKSLAANSNYCSKDCVQEQAKKFSSLLKEDDRVEVKDENGELLEEEELPIIEQLASFLIQHPNFVPVLEDERKKRVGWKKRMEKL